MKVAISSIIKVISRPRNWLAIIIIALFTFVTDCRCLRDKDHQSQQVHNDNKRDFDLNRFAEDPAIRKMVYETRFSEIARRYGDTIFVQTYKLTISSGNRSIEFTNRDLIEQAKNGDYHIRSENSANKLIEAYYIDKRLYLSTDGKEFFIQSDDIVDARARKEGVYSQANLFLKAYSDYIKFIADGEEEIDGIKFLRYRVSVNKGRQKVEGNRYYTLENIDGYILLDRRSSGIVRVKLKGNIKYQKGSSSANSEFLIESYVRKATLPLRFDPPPVGAEPKKIRIEKDLLKRLEKMEEEIDTE